MIEHHFGGGVYAKQAIIPAGVMIVQHQHKYDHLSILASGSIELVVDGSITVVHAPACLTIAANKHHGIKALTDVVWYCIHATECIDASLVDDVVAAPVNEPQARAVFTMLGG